MRSKRENRSGMVALCLGLSLFRREREDVQGMNFGLHHLSQRAIDELVTLQGAQTREARRNDLHAKMSFAFACACVSSMKMTFVNELDACIREVLANTCVDSIWAGAGRGRVHALVESDESAGIFDAIHAP